MALVMIVENNINEALSLQAMLSNMDLETTVVTCKKGEAALDYIDAANEPVDLFFIDEILPTISGYTVAEEIRSRKRYAITPIVFITNNNMDKLNAYQKYHCYSFIKKPVNDAQVKKQLSDLLNAIKENKEVEQGTINQLLTINTREGVNCIYLRNLLSIEVVGKDCALYTVNNKYIVPRKTLNDLIHDIGVPYIVRCHKSFGINVLNVKGLVKKKRNLWEPVYRNVDNEFASCFISGTYYEAVMDCLNKTIVDNLAVKNS